MAQVFSQNGWPAYDNTSKFTRLTAAGQKWWVANADAAVVFGEFINRFDKEVEEITQATLDDWSYANRLVRGSTSVVSNHGSATAIDINALKHPRGKRGTFSAAKAVVVRRIKNSITDNAGRPVLRLGMDYKTTVDDMHIEIDVTPGSGRLKQAADKIRARNAPKPPPAKPTPPKEPTVAKTDLNLDQQFILGKSAADNMSTPELPRKTGGTVNLDYILQWGGAGVFRVWKNVVAARSEIAALATKVGDLANVVTPLRGDSARQTAAIEAQTAAIEALTAALTKPPAQ